MVTYHNYFYDTVLRLKKKDRKESILGVLSTMCLCEDHIETHNVRRSLMSSSKWIEFNEKLDWPIVVPIEVLWRTQIIIEWYLLNQKVA